MGKYPVKTLTRTKGKIRLLFITYSKTDAVDKKIDLKIDSLKKLYIDQKIRIDSIVHSQSPPQSNVIPDSFKMSVTKKAVP